MKTKKIIVLIILLGLVIFAFLYYSKSQKDEWARESSEIKYSEEREKEVWGEILRGNDPALYYGTPLYDLAEALSSFSHLQNDEKIKKLIDEVPKEYINFQDDKYGKTIGQFALFVGNLKAVRQLLDRGLNPNLIANDGDALIIDINGPFESNLPESLETLKYMIKKGANVNLYSKNAQLSTPLVVAAYSNFENVKVLVEAGADPHFIDEFSARPFQSPLSAALVSGRIEIVNYLIFNQKVDFRTLKQPMESKFHPGDYEILYSLREMFFKLDSKEYKEKMKLIAYLKTQGLDYSKTPIEERYKNNPNYTPEYLSKY